MLYNLLNDLLTAFLFFLPAGLANMAPIFVSKLPGLKKLEYPLDFGLSYKGIRIFGAHKTWRGMISGILFGIVCASFIVQIPNFPFSNLNPIIFGFLSAFGALMGDAIKSFFKRRTKVAVAPGKSWFPYDQIDYIVGGIFGTLIYVRLNFTIYCWIILLYFGLHLLISYVGYLLKFKKEPI